MTNKIQSAAKKGNRYLPKKISIGSLDLSPPSIPNIDRLLDSWYPGPTNAMVPQNPELTATREIVWVHKHPNLAIFRLL